MFRTLCLAWVLLIVKCFSCSNWQGPFENVAGSESAPNAIYIYPKICSNNGYRMAVWQRALFNPVTFDMLQSLLQYAFYDPNLNSWTPVSNPPPVFPSVIFPPGYIDIDYDDALIRQESASVCCFPNGNAMVLWNQDVVNSVSGSGPGILSSYYTVGTGWSSPVMLNLAGAVVGSPDLTCTDSGQAVAVWVENAAFPGVPIRYSYFNGVSWSPQGSIPSSTALQGDLHLCGNNAGQAVAVWRDSSSGIFASTLTPPTTWSPAVQISANPIFTSFSLDVACDPNNGNAVAMWAEQGSWFSASVYNAASGTWGPPQQITNVAQYGVTPPLDKIPSGQANICIGQDGNAHLMFYAVDVASSNPVLLSVTYDALTATFSSPIVIQDTVSQDQRFSNPQVCCGACGDATAIWSWGENGAASSPSQVQMATYSGPSQQWLPVANTNLSDLPVLIPLDDFKELSRPNLACDLDGNVYPISNNFQGILTRAGYCGTYIVPSTLQIQNVTNRFPFQTECFSLLTWNTYPCLSGVVSVQILVNDALKATIPGKASSAKVQRLSRGDVVTVRPVNALGFVGIGEKILVP